MKAMRTVKDVMDKVQSIHEASSWINHICVQKAADMTEQCRSGLMMADDLLEEYETLLQGMQLGGAGDYE